MRRNRLMITRKLLGSRNSSCSAHARSTGKPCRAKALRNGRCRNHGGLSSGPNTPEGKAAVSKASKKRYHQGGKEALKTGYKRWLEAGGREMLSRLAKRRWRLLKLINDLYFREPYARTRCGVKRLGSLRTQPLIP
jgi:hypothetical protein